MITHALRASNFAGSFRDCDSNSIEVFSSARERERAEKKNKYIFCVKFFFVAP